MLGLSGDVMLNSLSCRLRMPVPILNKEELKRVVTDSHDLLREIQADTEESRARDVSYAYLGQKRQRAQGHAALVQGR